MEKKNVLVVIRWIKDLQGRCLTRHVVLQKPLISTCLLHPAKIPVKATVESTKCSLGPSPHVPMLQAIELLVAKAIGAIVGALVTMVSNCNGEKLEVGDNFVS